MTLPALIDYENDGPEGFTGKDLIAYWKACLLKYHSMAGTVWTLRDKGIASRLAKEFSRADLYEMIEHWMMKSEAGVAPRLNLFYKDRYQILNEVSPKDYQWE